MPAAGKRVCFVCFDLFVVFFVVHKLGQETGAGANSILLSTERYSKPASAYKAIDTRLFRFVSALAACQFSLPFIITLAAPPALPMFSAFASVKVWLTRRTVDITVRADNAKLAEAAAAFAKNAVVAS